MGMNIEMQEGKGPVVLKPIVEPSDIDALRRLDDSDLSPVYNALFITRHALRGNQTLLGKIKNI